MNDKEVTGFILTLEGAQTLYRFLSAVRGTAFWIRHTDLFHDALDVLGMDHEIPRKEEDWPMSYNEEKEK